MGYHVMGFGIINLFEGSIEDIEMIVKFMKKLKDDFFNIESGDGWINFKMEGNKGIDFDPLEKVKEFILKKELKFDMTVSEYSECQDGGFYFDSKEE